ncbi:hypothetical protein C8R44DRAFT_881563 [Mycena epipterygia]|nr:hypothetical protein C8R44DRAFT_881563 [Mycena epipterygia]
MVRLSCTLFTPHVHRSRISANHASAHDDQLFCDEMPSTHSPSVRRSYSARAQHWVAAHQIRASAHDGQSLCDEADSAHAADGLALGAALPIFICRTASTCSCLLPSFFALGAALPIAQAASILACRSLRGPADFTFSYDATLPLSLSMPAFTFAGASRLVPICQLPPDNIPTSKAYS